MDLQMLDMDPAVEIINLIIRAATLQATDVHVTIIVKLSHYRI